MPCQVLVIGGPARSGKTTRLLREYGQAISAGPIGSTLWLSPHHRAVGEVSERLLADGFTGCLSPNLLTFARLSERILVNAAQPLRPLSRGMVRLTLRNVIARCLAEGRLPYFRPIAETPGFLDLIAGFIRELKRLEIWPEELAKAQGRHASPRDRELCLVYHEYQNLLNAGDLYDEQGRFWTARELLKDGQWGAFASLRSVFVDGFTDFTRTELDVLELLAGRVERMSISLLRDAESSRGELFARVEQTLAALRGRCPQLEVEQLARRPIVPAAVAHLERTLFGNPRLVEPLDDSRGIEVVAAAGVTHEIELVAERIKKLLATGDGGRQVRANDILVVFRSLTEPGNLVREVFARYGVPVAVASSRSLSSFPLVAALVRWLRLDVEDWPFRSLVAALGSTYFQPRWPEFMNGRGAVALVRLARELELPAGRSAFLSSVAWLAAKARERLVEKRRISAKLAAADLAAPLIQRIAESFDRLPRQATPTEWSRALHAFATDLGMLNAASANPLGEASAAADLAAWERIVSALVEAERLARWTGSLSPRWSRTDLLHFLEDVCGSDSLPAATGEHGMVRVLAAENVRGLSAPYVFICGLSEKAFPPPHREDCLYTDADARRWGASGLPLPSNAERGRFEMLLFYEVVTRATRQLVLSYPALDAQAQTLVPSPFLREIEHVCGTGRIPRNAHPHLDCVPPSDAVVSRRDLRVRAVAEALAGRESLFEQLCAHPQTTHVARNIFAGLTMTDARDGSSFGRFDGMLSSDAARVKLAEVFGPAACWSPSKLEEYANCPHQFFLRNVLRLRPLAEPELVTDFMGRGQVLHWLLAQAHRAINDCQGGPTSPCGQALNDFRSAVERLAHDLRREGAAGTLAAGLVEINVRQVLNWLERYQGHHANYDAQWAAWRQPPRPAHFEVAFGPQREDDSDEERPDARDPLSSDEAFELECDGEIVRFNGRIDRIDLGCVGSQQTFTIVDYKSGKPRAQTKLAAVWAGNALQLPLYALAAQKLLAASDAVPFRAAYWHLAGEGYQDEQAVKFYFEADGRLELADEWSELEAFLRARIASLVRGIRQGEFPMFSTDDKCTSLCDYSTVCHVNQARSRDKQWQPPGDGAS